MLKAQAVAARTYALHQIENGTSQFRYHLTSSVLHQMFRGGAVADAVAQAVEDTRGEILTFEGKPIAAYYHSTSDGMTEDRPWPSRSTRRTAGPMRRAGPR